MTYVDGGLKYVNTYKYGNAKTYLSTCKTLCRMAAVLGYIDAGLITAASGGLAAILGGVGLSCVGSTMWSWADVYGSARMDVDSLSSKKKVQITEQTSGLTLRVTVKSV